MRLEPVTSAHYPRLYQILLKAEPWNACSFEVFEAIAVNRSGFSIVSNTGDLVGCVSFSDFAPGLNIVVHCFVEERHRSRWVSRQALKEIAAYIFGHLGLHRMSGYSITGISDKAGEFLLKLGFMQEGTIRQGRKIDDKFYDIKMYGLLKEECRWR